MIIGKDTLADLVFFFRQKPSVTLISPTIEGVAEVARRWRLGQSIAVPTECTYEVGMRLATGSMMRLTYSETSDYRSQPHVYMTAKALETSTPTRVFLEQQLPTRKYAFTKEGKVQSLHSFSESMQVLKRLAGRLWPGPVILHIAVDPVSPPSSPTSTSRPPVTTPSQYIALRCPCHPLSVKLCQEYYRDEAEDQVLIGLPIIGSDSTYITAAADICAGPAAVLNGEERLEIFAVPTCEYAQPPSTRLWIDERRRLIRLERSSTEAKTGKESLTALLHALSSKASVKERVVAAVLQKWTIEEE